jgi:hypothetical protein
MRRKVVSELDVGGRNALYVPKEQGRNRVCGAAESPSLMRVRPAG